MTDADRLLLEDAARAAGYVVSRWTDDGTALLLEGVEAPWNSLHPTQHSDCMGDAMRLADALAIDVLHRFVGGRRCEALAPGGPAVREFAVENNGSTLHAACRAITRAAAAVWRNRQ